MASTQRYSLFSGDPPAMRRGPSTRHWLLSRPGRAIRGTADVVDVRGGPLAPLFVAHVGGALVAQHFWRRDTPYPHRLVPAGAGQLMPVGAERHTHHLGGVAGRSAHHRRP